MPRREGLETVLRASGVELSLAQPGARPRPPDGVLEPLDADERQRARFERGDAGIGEARTRSVEGKEARQPERGDRQRIPKTDAASQPAGILVPLGEIEGPVVERGGTENEAAGDERRPRPVDFAGDMAGAEEVIRHQVGPETVAPGA